MDNQTSLGEPAPQVDAKQPYETPQLTYHGTIEDLTAEQGGAGGDVLGGGTS